MYGYEFKIERGSFYHADELKVHPSLHIRDLERLSNKELLELAVEKWYTIREHVGKLKKELTAGEIDDDCGVADGSDTTCALCQVYNSAVTFVGHKCNDCPITLKTGVSGCLGTPYEYWINCETIDEHLETAHDEYEYLKALMEEAE